MNTVEILTNKIKEEFKDVPFPYHLGINAALAMDGWITDTEELKEITNKKDLICNWWEIPIVEFQHIALALCYFYAKATEFYLPAFMVITLNQMTYANCNTLVLG